MKPLNVQSLLWLALALALAGSLKHLAAVFATVDGNTLMGWLQAIAIDVGLFALAYSIKQRKAANSSTKALWFGVGLFILISIYGNLYYGFVATSQVPLWMELVKPYVLAGSLPVLVLYLAELVSDNRQVAMSTHRVQAAKPTPKKQTTPKQKKIKQLAGILAEKPNASNSELATLLDVSRGTIRNYRAELATNGKGAS